MVIFRCRKIFINPYIVKENTVRWCFSLFSYIILEISVEFIDVCVVAALVWFWFGLCTRGPMLTKTSELKTDTKGPHGASRP